MAGDDTSGMLASWFILALSSLHFGHTLSYLNFPWRFRLQLACGNGLMKFGDDEPRPILS